MNVSKSISLAVCFAALVFSLSLVRSEAHAAGYQTLSLKVSHRDSPLSLHIWYPSKDDGADIMLGKNVVFKGVQVRAGATPIKTPKTKFPLVVLSHGSGGNAVNIAWIGAALADAGMIVVATNHPGSTSGDSTPMRTLKIWQRPADLSAIITRFEKQPPFGLRPDMKKVGAVGFSLGGYSVLGLAGAQVRKQKYIDYCDGELSRLDCAWFAKAGVDLNIIEKSKFEAIFADVRLKTVVAIDPGLAQAFDISSLKSMKLPTLIINLGAKGHVPRAIDGEKIASLLLRAKHMNIKGASHFSFLAQCTKIGESIIKSKGEEPICSEVGTRKRSDIHQQLKEIISAFLMKQFK